MALEDLVESIASVVHSASGEPGKGDRQQASPTETTSPEPLEINDPGWPSGDPPDLWDSEIDGFYVLNERIAGTDESGGSLNREYLTDSSYLARWMSGNLGKSLATAREMLREYLFRIGPRGPFGGGPRPPMPA
jgi:hypothetical protein